MGRLDVASFLTALGSASLKATVILALAALLTRLLRRRPAALRHLVWTAGLGSTVAVLVLPVVLPAWHVMPVPSVSVDLGWPDAREVVPPPLQDGIGGLAERQNGRAVAANASPSRDVTPVTLAVSRAAPTSGAPGWLALALGLWLVGGAVVVARYAWSWLALYQLARSSTIMAGSKVVAEHILREFGISRPVSFRSSGEVELPLTWGILRPQVVLPIDASEWTPDCCRRVLQHELAHVKRHDATTQLVAQAASALFWFHPLVWYAVGQMRCERERACDDYVLTSGAVASDYASDLLTLVTTHGYVERHWVAMAFARRSHFEGRLLALLDRTVDRGVVAPRRAALVLSLAAAFVAPLATVQSAGTRTAPRAAGASAAAGVKSLGDVHDVPATATQPSVHGQAPIAGVARDSLIRDSDRAVRPMTDGTTPIRGQVTDLRGSLTPQNIGWLSPSGRAMTPQDPFADTDFVVIQPGTFQMGDSTSVVNGVPWPNAPVHTVTLTHSFGMQRTVVTQAQWQAVMGYNPSHYKDCPACPVDSVSYDDVKAFIAKLDSLSEKQYRLPTEAEWEYAARAGTTGDYGTPGDVTLGGWIKDNSGGYSHPVGELHPNAWGLYDMEGNVWEWMNDWWGPYPSGQVIDPTGPSSGQGCTAVPIALLGTGFCHTIRGGSYLGTASTARSAFRMDCGAPWRNIGFRLARSD
jgi:formylglycine-generating enzyme required for sulfatase activity/beta-lactamase regulating signal transducer with metallopeptidase domain